MYAERHRVVLTTDENGDAVGYTPEIRGRVLEVVYTKPGSGGFADGVDFSLVGAFTGTPVWVEQDVNASKTVRPLAASHGTDGVALVDGAEAVIAVAPVVLAGERLSITVDDGGSGGETGTFDVVVI